MTKDSTLCNCSRDLHHCASLALGITLRQHLEEKLKNRMVCASVQYVIYIQLLLLPVSDCIFVLLCSYCLIWCIYFSLFLEM